MAVLTDITRALPDEQVHTRLASLTIQDFRNYDGCRLEIDAPKVLLLGENGSGKTNLMEAVSLLAPGRGLRRAKAEFGVPCVAYQVSGEYAMIKAASANNWLDGERAMIESLLGFKRAGADGILTYGALDAARYLKSG